MNKIVKNDMRGHNEKEQEVKLEDILKSIRGMINDHKLDYNYAEDSDNNDHPNQHENIKYQVADESELDNSEDVLELDNVVHNNDFIKSANNNNMSGNNYDEPLISKNKYASEFDKNAHYDANNSGEILSKQAKLESTRLLNEFANQAKEVKSNSDEDLDNLVYKLIRPMLKDWLDNNLPKLVENVVRDEIRRLTPKK